MNILVRVFLPAIAFVAIMGMGFALGEEPADNPTNTERIIGEKTETVVLVPAEPAKPKYSHDDLRKSVVRLDSVSTRNGGTGFYIGKNLIVTAHHIVEVSYNMMGMTIFVGDLKHMVVEVYGGRKTIATLVYADKEHDFAILELDDDLDLVPLKLAEATPKEGDAVHSVSHPVGFRFIGTDGILLTAAQKQGDDDVYGLAHMFISYGSSGSPVVNDNMEVIGITNKVALGGGMIFLPSPAFAPKVKELLGK